MALVLFCSQHLSSGFLSIVEHYWHFLKLIWINWICMHTKPKINDHTISDCFKNWLNICICTVNKCSILVWSITQIEFYYLDLDEETKQMRNFQISHKFLYQQIFRKYLPPNEQITRKPTQSIEAVKECILFVWESRSLCRDFKTNKKWCQQNDGIKTLQSLYFCRSSYLMMSID